MECVVQGLEAATNFFLGNLSQGTDLLESTRDTLLSTSNKDTCGDDTFIGLASQELFILNSLKQLLCDIGC